MTKLSRSDKQKKQIADLKASLKWEKQLHGYTKENEEKQRRFANDLQAKLDTALGRLEVIAKGFTYIGESLDAKSIAAVGLKNIARMQERKP